jgi:riboflavin kinase
MDMQQVSNIYSVEEQIFISGVVVYGRQKGRELSFPTANINADARRLESGVYGVYVSLNETQYQGIMNIGVKPTYGSTLKKQ